MSKTQCANQNLPTGKIVSGKARSPMTGVDKLTFGTAKSNFLEVRSDLGIYLEAEYPLVGNFVETGAYRPVQPLDLFVDVQQIFDQGVAAAAANSMKQSIMNERFKNFSKLAQIRTQQLLELWGKFRSL